MDSSRKFLIVSISAAVLLIILVSCTLAYSGRDNTLMSDKTLSLEINGFNVELPLSENDAVYDAVSLSSVKENRIKLINEVGATVKINGKGIGAGTTMDLKLEKLSSNEMIKIQVGNEKDERVIYLRTLSSQLPEIIPAGESSYEGNYFMAVATGGAALYELNNKGEVVFYIAKSPEEANGESYRDFKKHVLENGDVRYSYQRVNGDSNGIGYAVGERVILDENYKELKAITLADSELANEGDPVDGRDFILIDDNHYIVEASQLVLVHNVPEGLGPNTMGSKVVRTLIQEVKDDQVVFEFTTDSHPEFYGLSVTDHDYSNTTSQSPDYAGFNRMIIDPTDNNLIVSFGNLNTIMKINRETKAVIWKLSGNGDEFGMSPEQKTSGQTDLAITAEGELTVFDNAISTGQTRILKIKLDEVNKKILGYQEYKVAGKTSLAYGSAQKIGDNIEVYTIGWGLTKDGTVAVSEIDFNTGKKLLEVTLPQGVANDRVQKFK
ncbi:MAG: aryl-sulfate sulfotransferase [Acetobacterium sp.]|nr:aryl-sulfate sulfotransferase [Bacillota bacterium]MCG2730642.1 aryl-sulfate sulfotransferase [Acetobacterium sp.]